MGDGDWWRFMVMTSILNPWIPWWVIILLEYTNYNNKQSPLITNINQPEQKIIPIIKYNHSNHQWWLKKNAQLEVEWEQTSLFERPETDVRRADVKFA